MDKNIRKVIGSRIRLLRGARTQDWLAGAAKLSSVSVRMIEKGEQNFTIDNLIEICKVLKVDLQTILADDNTTSTESATEASLKPGYGEQIKRYRGRRGLTQDQLGKKLGINDQVISRWESEQQEPTPEQQDQLSSALQVHKRVLFSSDEAQALDFDDVIQYLTNEHESLLKATHRISQLEAEIEAMKESTQQLTPRERELIESYRRLSELRQLFANYYVSRDPLWKETIEEFVRTHAGLEEELAQIGTEIAHGGNVFPFPKQ